MRDLFERHAVSAQPIRVHLDLVLAHATADRNDLRYALNREEAATHRPLRRVAHLERLVRLASQADEHDLAHHR